MRACIHFSVVVILMFVYAAKGDITEVSLDDESVCDGNPFEIKEGNELHLVSKGMVPKSMCGVRMNVQRSQNCRGVCFNLRSSNFADCSARLVTTEIHFGEMVPDVIKEENCQTSMEVPWCSSAHTLILELVIDEMIITHRYNFSASVYPRCGDDVVYKAPSTNQEEGVRMTLIYGVLTGTCLCLAFLILFIVTCYCYRIRNRGHTILPSVSKDKTSKIPGEAGKPSSSTGLKDTYLAITGMEKEGVNLLIIEGSKSK
ncbi:hypothetical protein ACJMK2_015675 [Sinanodonta woodiana]|uniref:Uncharacterized protein n=1 Tax=Sinanodonta woodiana TaxID=1069815 RepID=A0ABD3UT77_SINWO